MHLAANVKMTGCPTWSGTIFDCELLETGNAPAELVEGARVPFRRIEGIVIKMQSFTTVATFWPVHLVRGECIFYGKITGST